MGHTYTCLLTHIVYATGDRSRTLTPELTRRLFPYMGGIVRGQGGTSIVINGPEDHVHLLVRMPATLAVATLAQKVKGDSSRWVNEHRLCPCHFGWQPGYGAFAVSHDRLQTVREYIARQQEHHRGVSFRDEMAALLTQHGIEYDERYLLG